MKMGKVLSEIFLKWGFFCMPFFTVHTPIVRNLGVGMVKNGQLVKRGSNEITFVRNQGV